MFRFCIILVSLASLLPHCVKPQQWGKMNIAPDKSSKLIALPIAFKKYGYISVATDVGEGCERIGCSIHGLAQIEMYTLPGKSYSAWYIVLGI